MKSYYYVAGLVFVFASLLGVAAPVANAGWISPTDVPLSSGGPYGGLADYAAGKTIDGDPATFCALLDDTLTGSNDPVTTPPYAAAPTTGYMLFDLGSPQQIDGARLTSRNTSVSVHPKSVAFYLSNAAGADLGTLASHTYSAIMSNASENIAWTAATSQYIGLRVNSSYEQGDALGGGNYNFQIAEMQFNTVPEPSAVVLLITGLIGLLAYTWRQHR